MDPENTNGPSESPQPENSPERLLSPPLSPVAAQILDIIERQIGDLTPYDAVEDPSWLSMEERNRFSTTLQMISSVLRDAADSFPEEYKNDLNGISTSWSDPDPDLDVRFSGLIPLLGILPRSVDELLRSEMSGELSGQRPIPVEQMVDPQRIQDSMGRDSFAEWVLLTHGLRHGERPGYPSDVVLTMGKFLELALDPEKRHQWAVRRLQDYNDNLLFIEECGGQLPVQVAVHDPIRSRRAPDRKKTSANLLYALLGYPGSVVYFPQSGVWDMAFLIEGGSEVTGDAPLVSSMRRGWGSFKDRGGGLAWSRQGLRNMLATAGVRVEPGPDLSRGIQMVDLYGGGRAHSPYFVHDNREMRLSDHAAGSIDASTFQMIGGEWMLTGEQMVIAHGTEVSTAGIRFNIEVSNKGDRELCHFFSDQSLGPNSQAVVRFRRAVSQRQVKLRDFSWEDGNWLYVFDKPLMVGKSGMLLESESFPPREERFNIYGYQIVDRGLGALPLIVPPSIQTADARFTEKPPIELTYELDDLPLNVPLNRHRLARAFDPAVDELGFPRDDRGNNAIVDFWDVTIPLVKPTQEQFETELLRPIRGLRGIPQAGWGAFLPMLEGEWLDVLEDVEQVSLESDGDAPGDGPGPGPAEPRIGEFFRGPKRGPISVHGPWVHSRGFYRGRVFHIVDSTQYGTALHLFRTEEAAREAATLLHSGERREKVRLINGFVSRRIHSENWRMNLTRDIFEKIFYLPVPDEPIVEGASIV